MHLTSSFLVGLVLRASLFRHNVKVFNKESLLESVYCRPTFQSLITVSNHHSCLDDFILFGTTLKISDLMNVDSFRWSLVANDICFKSMFSYFFVLGKGIPVWRNVYDIETKKLTSVGGGRYQPSMDFTLSLLNNGFWVHIFP
ncbi:unnamed protein product, partial [Protopolystoma xenopodis]